MRNHVYVQPKALLQVHEAARVRGVSVECYVEQALMEAMERDVTRMYSPPPECWLCSGAQFFMGHRCTVCAA